MVSAQRWLFGGLGMWLTCCAFAQTAPAAPAAPAPPVVDESKLPDWVKRQARSPYKVIIESQPVKARPPAPREDDSARRVVRKAAPAAASIETVVADGHKLSPLAEATQTVPAAVESNAATAPTASIATLTAPAVDKAVPPEPAPAPALSPARAPAVETARALVPEPAGPAALLAIQEPPPLTLLEGAEPQFPADLLDSQFGRAEVVVAFTVSPNGEVGKLAVVASSNSRLNRSVLRAVQGWRYAPIPSAREHRISFTFKSQ